MPLALTSADRRARARADLRMGVPIVVQGGDAPMLAAAVEALDPERFAALAEGAELAITARRAETLKARPYDGDLARLMLPAGANLTWAQAVADPADDLAHPMKGPLASIREGDPSPARFAIGLAKEARLLPAILLRRLSTTDPVSDLTTLDLTRDTHSPAHYGDVVSARVPLQVSKAGRLHVFRPDDGAEEHYAVEIGAPDRAKPVLSRLHSACVTGDLMGSLKCDCGPQLQAALQAMGGEGQGILLYLNQEGRGIGLANKMRAYALQDQGFDTVEANHRLGFEDDERDFRIGSALLKRLGFSSVRLMTNNPAKISMMEAQGIRVTERVPLKVGRTDENADYLAVKASKSGHLL